MRVLAEQERQEQLFRERICSLPQFAIWRWSPEEWAVLTSQFPWNVRRGMSINELREAYGCD